MLENDASGAQTEAHQKGMMTEVAKLTAGSKDALDKGKRVATRVNALAADRRSEEIARMLAGAEVTVEARAAARRLLQAAS